MTPDNYQNLLTRIDEHIFTIILLSSFDSKTMVKLCNTCGIVYTGMRTKSVPSEKLAMDLAEDFFQNEASRKLIFKELTRVNAHYISLFHGMSKQEILSKINGMPEREFAQDLGRIVFALLMDSRPEVNRETEAIIRNYLADRFEEEEDEFYDEEEGEDEEYWDDLEEENEKLRKDNDQLTKRLERLEKDLTDKQREIENLQAKNKEVMTLLNEARKESNKLQGEVSCLQRDVEKLKLELEEEKKIKPDAELYNSMREILKQNKKINYHLEKMMEAPQPAVQKESPYLVTLATVLEDLKEKLTILTTLTETENRKTHKFLEDLKKDFQSLKTSTLEPKREPNRFYKPREGEERVGVFVDVQNMYYSARIYHAKLNFDQLLQAAVGPRRLIKAIAYVVQSKEIDQSGFITMLQQRNFEVKQKPLRVRSDGSSKADWDMEIAIDIIKLADQLDVVVLASGDGDFVALVNLIKTEGPKVEVLSFPHNTSKDLIEAADKYLPIEEGMLLR